MSTPHSPASPAPRPAWAISSRPSRSFTPHCRRRPDLTRDAAPATVAAMILASSLADLPRVRHAFFTREGGVSHGVYASMNGGQGSKDDPAHVAENRRRMAESLGAKTLVTAFQHHSAVAVAATEPWTREHAPRADAVVTNTPGIAIGVTIADCGPLLLADGKAGVIAAAH